MSRTDSFTIVFDGDIRAFKNNPFKTETPFGVPMTVGRGNAFEVADDLLAALNFALTDPCFSLLGSVTKDGIFAAIAKAEGRAP